MKFRRDITEFIWGLLWDGDGTLHSYPNKNYKVYLSNGGLIYMAYYFYENKNKISFYTDYSLCGVTDEIREKVREKFNVRFAEPDDDILCRCGEKKFTASYGSYELNLECVVCLNKFSAYSG